MKGGLKKFGRCSVSHRAGTQAIRSSGSDWPCAEPLSPRPGWSATRRAAETQTLNQLSRSIRLAFVTDAPL